MARWTARMLTSLAVAVACSLGATALPVGPAASGHAERAAAARPAVADAPADHASPASRLAAPTPRSDASVDVAATTDASAPPAGSSVPAIARPVVVPVTRHRALVGLAPATLGSRAPPAG
ncbi:hypothetical protein GA0070624_2795 [Micromonospora rhizosphaerae]|uniref:Uncharacterized protein n=1 Tax=Micromonospora rhizosphaerae TaxID=568872 RepID=A0A1C6S2P0_9ACTN|nr:hypothetical protein [Micromonospora rhizosphaerae]SCL23760.1 hypothetical protein GA0070624_2795 [Micromonospora rhizosphaerae]